MQFAVGIVTGTVLCFEFGLLWPGLVGRWGDGGIRIPLLDPVPAGFSPDTEVRDSSTDWTPTANSRS